MIDTLLRASGSLSTQTVLTAPIDAAAVMVGVVMDKTLWASLTAKCSALIEVSTDGGQSFISLAGFVNEPGGGGQGYALRPLPPQQGQPRQARFTFTPSASLVTTITMRTLDGKEPRVLGA